MSPALSAGVAVATLLAVGVPAWLFQPAQAARDLPISRLTVTIASLLAGAVTFTAGLLGPADDVHTLLTAAATGVLVYLATITLRTDLTVWKIPKETCWHGLLIGLGLAAAYLLTPGATQPAMDRWVTLALSALIVLVAGVSWFLGSGGFGDFRLLLAAAALSAWWVPSFALLIGVLASIVITLLVVAVRRSRNDKGKLIVPAGPSYVLMFTIAALLTVAGAS